MSEKTIPYKIYLEESEMSDYVPTDDELAKGFAGIPDFPGNV